MDIFFDSFSLIEFWVILGTICLITEFAISGIGFLFLGLGCLSNAVLIYSYPSLSMYQYTAFGLLSFLWLAILWLPLRRYMHIKSKNNQPYTGMIGNEVEVYNNQLLPDHSGQVKWSGTIMNARLDKAQQDAVAVGDKLYIIDVQGNVLICSRTKKI